MHGLCLGDVLRLGLRRRRFTVGDVLRLATFYGWRRRRRFTVAYVLRRRRFTVRFAVLEFTLSLSTLTKPVVNFIVSSL